MDKEKLAGYIIITLFLISFIIIIGNGVYREEDYINKLKSSNTFEECIMEKHQFIDVESICIQEFQKRSLLKNGN